MEFKDRLRMMRKEKGLTQKQLGELIGVGRTTISEYESGKIVPRQDGLVKLAEVLHTSVDFLTGLTAYAVRTDEGNIFQLDEPIMSTIRLMKRDDIKVKFFEQELTEQQKIVVLQHIRTMMLMLNEFGDELC